ncbi:hypothetical protein AMECASPLE_006621 [Ameca splendens]|uniref:Uncharacterized protein n=1 Tax=Ameca splendens TaxID=208324 RepID=A0ABV0ZJ88_9TELE
MGRPWSLWREACSTAESKVEGSVRILRLQDGWNSHKVQSILGAAITAVNHSDNICRPLPPRRLDGNGKGGQGAKSWPIKTGKS